MGFNLWANIAYPCDMNIRFVSYSLDTCIIILEYIFAITMQFK